MRSKIIFALGLGVLSIQHVKAQKECLTAEQVMWGVLTEAVGNPPKPHYELVIKRDEKPVSYKRTITDVNASPPGHTHGGKCTHHVQVIGTIQGPCGVTLAEVHEAQVGKFQTPSTILAGTTFHRSLLANKLQLSEPTHQKDGSCKYELKSEQFLQEVSE